MFNEQDALKAVCGGCNQQKRYCSCPKGKKGGSGSSGQENIPSIPENGNNIDLLNPNSSQKIPKQISSLLANTISAFLRMVNGYTNTNTLSPEFNHRNYTLQELLEKILLITYKNGFLIMQPHPQFKLSEDQKAMLLKLFTALATELDKFKDQLLESGVSENEINAIEATIDKKESAFTVHIPNPEHYNAFINLINEKMQLVLPQDQVQRPVLKK